MREFSKIYMRSTKKRNARRPNEMICYRKEQQVIQNSSQNVAPEHGENRVIKFDLNMCLQKQEAGNAGTI